MKKILLLLALIIPIVAEAQPPRGPGGRGGGRMKMDPNKGAIAGKVMDKSTGLGISFANIAVYKSGTEELVAGNNSRDDGGFFVKDLDFGTYDLKINFIGYSEFSKEKIEINEENRFARMRQIMLSEDAQQLAEVEVTAKREMVQFGLDKRVFNVDKDLSAAGGDATEVLKNIPSVEVDIDGNVSLRGNANVRVFINGRPSGIVGLSRQAVLQQIPANIIQRIEVMTNPSAKYSPEGMTGIINIITKKQNKRGFNLNAQTSYDTNKSAQASLNLNYRIGKFNWFGNYAFQNRRRFRKGLIDNENLVSFVGQPDIQESIFEIDGFRKSHTVSGGFEYYFDASSVLSLNGSSNWRGSDMQGGTDFINFDKSRNLLGSSRRNDTDISNSIGGEYALNYNKTYSGEDQSLSLIASFSNSNGDELEAFEESFFEADGSEFGDRLIQSTPVFDKNQLLLLQGDYSQKANGIKWETGYRITIQDQENDYDRLDFGVLNDTFSNVFTYDEDVYAVYLLASGTLNKFEYSLGLRAEQALTTSSLEDTRFSSIEEFPVQNDYFRLYPSAAIAYPTSENGKIQINYSRRVNRPRLRMLNPALDISNPLNPRSGNPFILPEFINSYEIGYLKSFEKGTFNTNFFFRDIFDKHARLVEESPSTGQRISTWGNFDNERNYGVELIGSYRPNRKINMNGSVSGYWQEVDAGDILEGASSTGFQWSGRLISNFTIWKDANIQSFIFYRSKGATPQGTRFEFAWTDLAFRKPFYKKRASITIKLSDVFNTRRFRFELETARTIASREFRWPSRALSVQLNYQIGKQDRKKRRRGNRSGGGDFGGEEF